MEEFLTKYGTIVWLVALAVFFYLFFNDLWLGDKVEVHMVKEGIARKLND